LDRPLADRDWRTNTQAGTPDPQLTNWFGESSLWAQLEPLVGQDCLPDPAFFVESWTLGATVAADNLRRRHHEARREREPLPLDSFRPFVASADWLRSAAIPLPQGFSWRVDGAPDNRACDFTGPVTLEGARALLGVTAGSTRDQIKAAYRQLAGRHHPDRHAAQGDGERRVATERMAAINEAYRLLCGRNGELLA
jgi:DnaJ-domain-containing protein 1